MAEKKLESLILGALGRDGFAEELERTEKERSECVDAIVIRKNDHEAMRIFIGLSARDRKMVVDILKDIHQYVPALVNAASIEALEEVK